MSAPVEGSYDHRVSVALQRRQWVSVPRSKVDVFDKEGKRVGRKWQNETFMEECPPYLEVEGSIDKAMLGHNVDGGPDLVAAAVRWFVGELAGQLDLPIAEVGWEGRGYGLPAAMAGYCGASTGPKSSTSAASGWPSNPAVALPGTIPSPQDAQGRGGVGHRAWLHHDDQDVSQGPRIPGA